MLVLSRKVGEKFWIGDRIAVTVVRVSGGGVRIGIDAPEELVVVREELREKAVAKMRKSPSSGSETPSNSPPSGKPR